MHIHIIFTKQLRVGLSGILMAKENLMAIHSVDIGQAGGHQQALSKGLFLVHELTNQNKDPYFFFACKK